MYYTCNDTFNILPWDKQEIRRECLCRLLPVQIQWVRTVIREELHREPEVQE